MQLNTVSFYNKYIGLSHRLKIKLGARWGIISKGHVFQTKEHLSKQRGHFFTQKGTFFKLRVLFREKGTFSRENAFFPIKGLSQGWAH